MIGDILPKPQGQEKPKSKYWKFIVGFLVLMAIALFGFPLLKNLYYSIAVNKTISDYQSWESNYLNAVKNDTYGGKTPQETYEKFIAALKNNDILSAAKYYLRDEDKISAYKKFDDLQKNGKFEEWVSNLPAWSQMKEVEYWDPNGKEFQYTYTQREDYTIYDVAMQQNRTIKAGAYKSSIIFELSDSGLWKIFQF